jgi:hypothetical protein
MTVMKVDNNTFGIRVLHNVSLVEGTAEKPPTAAANKIGTTYRDKNWNTQNTSQKYTGIDGVTFPLLIDLAFHTDVIVHT